MVRETVITLMIVAHDEALQSASEWANIRVYRRTRTSVPPTTQPEGSPSPVEVGDQLSDYNHARGLRAMADLVNKVASALSPETPMSTTD